MQLGHLHINTEININVIIINADSIPIIIFTTINLIPNTARQPIMIALIGKIIEHLLIFNKLLIVTPHSFIIILRKFTH